MKVPNPPPLDDNPEFEQFLLEQMTPLLIDVCVQTINWLREHGQTSVQDFAFVALMYEQVVASSLALSAALISVEDDLKDDMAKRMFQQFKDLKGGGDVPLE